MGAKRYPFKVHSVTFPIPFRAEDDLPDGPVMLTLDEVSNLLGRGVHLEALPGDPSSPYRPGEVLFSWNR